LKNISPARVAAFDALKEIEDGKFSSVVLPEKETQLSPLDRALCHELVLGVLRWQLQLDKIIEHFAKRRIDSIDPPVRRALRIGIYQLRFLSRVPASAAVNESVNLVARARVSSARAFVNAVLRCATRESDYSPFAAISDPVERIAIETSHPPWLVERWANAFGLEHAEMFARANNETPPVAIRVVSAAPETVLDKIRSAGGIVTPSEIVEAAWRVSGAPARVRELAAAGEIYIQDEASQLVAQVVEARPSERILDVCAAPGGKTTLIAHRSQGGSVFAMDVSEQRLATVATTVALQRLNNITLVIADAGSSLPFRNESFDRVLVDAPCSGTGTLRHNPEIRWRLKNDDIPELARQQLRFLMNASMAVKQNGLLVYSTCSVELEENEEVVEQFLSTNKLFEQIPVIVNERLLMPEGSARTWPHRDGTDGFFIAAFRRV
jgi:16S rRNA (cytosine967-C5)-methyltransferase